MPLKGKAVRHLRALGHGLNPVVQVGKDGVSEGTVHACDAALADHELIKVRVLRECPLPAPDAATEIAKATGAEIAQVLGHTFLIYRPDPETPKILLPKSKGKTEAGED